MFAKRRTAIFVDDDDENVRIVIERKCENRNHNVNDTRDLREIKRMKRRTIARYFSLFHFNIKHTHIYSFFYRIRHSLPTHFDFLFNVTMENFVIFDFFPLEFNEFFVTLGDRMA